MKYTLFMQENNYTTLPILSQFTHGFFTRHGGVSTGLFESLDCQLAPPRFLHERVMDNFACAQKALGVEQGELHLIEQVHGAQIYEARKGEGAIEQADASIARDEGVVLAVTTADCVPVLLGDAETGVVAAVHVGWRGALAHIIMHTLGHMQKSGVDMRHVCAGVGPSIAQEHLKLNAHIQESFIKKNPQSAMFFHEHHLDLSGLVVAQLEASGVENIGVVPMDTYSNQNYFSARRARHKGEYVFGAQPSLIVSGVTS